MSDLSKILFSEELSELEQDQLMRYLSGKVSEEERFIIENKMADSPFLNDAIEGLQDFSDPEKIAKITKELNRQIKKQTNKKILRKTKRKLKDQNWLIIAILCVIFLCIIGYLLIHFYGKHAI